MKFCNTCKIEKVDTAFRGETKGRMLSVDHDHVTGKLRGLLCSKCNTSLGMINDNIQILKNMIVYLESYGE